MGQPNSPRLRQLMLPGSASSWANLGFSITGGRFAVGSVDCLTDRSEVGWTLQGEMLDVDQVAGVPTSVVASAVEAQVMSAENQNGAFRVDHVVVASSAPSRTRAELERAGFVARGEREVGEGDERRSQVFFWAGEPLIELVGPTQEEKGGGIRAEIWGVAFVVPDFDALQAQAGELLSPARSAVQPGRQIVAVSASAGLGIAAAFMTPHVRTERS